MEFTVNGGSLQLLINMLRSPMALPTHMISQNFQHYRAKDEPGAREILALQGWLKKVCEETDGKPLHEVRMELKLKQSYINRLLDMLKHYAELGNLPVSAESYYRLKDALEGKDFEARLDDPSEE